MANKVFGDYNQHQLDAEYDNSAKVENAEQVIQGYTRASSAYRQSAVAELDVSYGKSADETLDVFYANGERQGTGRPVHVFFHGGYWRAMHKNDFSYVARGLADTRAICMVVNYALIPRVTMDELVEQCRRSLAWLLENAERFGGDPRSITISGHSAGGHLVAMMIATAWHRFKPACPANLVKSGIALSGLFDLEPIRLSYLNGSLGLDQDSARRNSPIYQENRNNAGLICCFGALEGAEYRRQSEALASVWQLTSARAIEHHDHFSICHELHYPDSPVSQIIKARIDEVDKATQSDD